MGKKIEMCAGIKPGVLLKEKNVLSEDELQLNSDCMSDLICGSRKKLDDRPVGGKQPSTLLVKELLNK
jgi:hypothetical protein